MKDFSYLFNHQDDKNFIIKLLSFSKKNYVNFTSCLEDLIDEMQNNEEFSLAIESEVSNLFASIWIRKYLIETGIVEHNSIISVVRQKLNDYFLPEIETDNSLSSVINEVLYSSNNVEMLKSISKETWRKFYKVLLNNKEDILKSNSLTIMLSESIGILKDRIMSGSFDGEFLRFNSNSIQESPFVFFGEAVRKITKKPNQDFDLYQIKDLKIKCENYLHNILIQKDKKGISMSLTFKIKRMQQQLDRIFTLIKDLLSLKTSQPDIFFATITRDWLGFYIKKNTLHNYISSTVYQLTFLATYHNGKTGEKYITTTKKEYFNMFKSAAGGGIIVSILCFIKLFISNQQNISPFIEALGYSLNYAIGFVAIYLFHFTLATKQPAMTAASIAKSLVTQENHELKVSEFIQLFRRLFRTQYIAFIGNVLACFGMVFLLFYIFKNFLNLEILSDTKANKMFHETLQPDFLIFYYGAIAGVFLFISGLSSGLIINIHRYRNIPERLYQQPAIKLILKPEKRKKWVNWFEKNSGAIYGNIILGFLLGSAFLIGKFLHIPFDIRHITFAAGNLAIAVSGLDYWVYWYEVVFCLIMVFGIGFFNFIVSFVLSLFLAMNSNQIPFKNIFPLFKEVFKNFIKTPFHYFFP
jgi:site-specific recombinase